MVNIIDLCYSFFINHFFQYEKCVLFGRDSRSPSVPILAHKPKNYPAIPKVCDDLTWSDTVGGGARDKHYILAVYRPSYV